MPLDRDHLDRELRPHRHRQLLRRHRVLAIDHGPGGRLSPRRRHLHPQQRRDPRRNNQGRDRAWRDCVRQPACSVVSLGSNNEYLASHAHLNEMLRRVQRIARREGFPVGRHPEDAAVRHDRPESGAHRTRGCRGSAFSSCRRPAIRPPSTRVRSSSATVFYDRTEQLPAPERRLYAEQHPERGSSSTASVNTTTGVIIAGDDSFGIRNLNSAATPPRSTKARSRRQRRLGAITTTRRTTTGCSSRTASSPSAQRHSLLASRPTRATPVRSRSAT